MLYTFQFWKEKWFLKRILKCFTDGGNDRDKESATTLFEVLYKDYNYANTFRLDEEDKKNVYLLHPMYSISKRLH